MSFTTQLSWRYATGKFNPDKPVETEKLDAILNAIRMAPSSFGLQPFHITVVSNREIQTELRTASWDQPQITTAQYVLVFSARNDVVNRVDEIINMMSGGDATKKAGLKDYEDMMKGSLGRRSVEEAKSWSANQAYIALGFGLAACAELSLDSCPMEGFSGTDYKKILKLQDNLDPVVLLCIGYRADDEEIEPKTRFPKEEIFSFVA